MLMLILFSIEDDIINAYNSYKAIKANVVKFEYNTYYVNVHFGNVMVKKPIIEAHGYVVFDFQNKNVEYNMINDKGFKIGISGEFDEEREMLDLSITYQDKSYQIENIGKIVYMVPYQLLKYLLLNNFEHNTEIYNNNIVITFSISENRKAKFVLNANDYGIKEVNYISNPFGIPTGKIIFDNIQIVQ